MNLPAQTKNIIWFADEHLRRRVLTNPVTPLQYHYSVVTADSHFLLGIFIFDGLSRPDEAQLKEIPAIRETAGTLLSTKPSQQISEPRLFPGCREEVAAGDLIGEVRDQP